jgi:F-type H+-transporting ATPase subunit delta
MNDRLSRLYAEAFMNAFFETLPSDILHRLLALQERIKSDHALQLVIALPGFKASKKNFLLSVFDSFGLNQPFASLLDLLLDQRRSFLLPKIMAALIQEYKKRAGLLDCTIRSAQPLSDAEQKQIIEHASQILGYTLLPTWIIDPSLIAGIRFETTEYLFDHSILNKLNALAVR